MLSFINLSQEFIYQVPISSNSKTKKRDKICVSANSKEGAILLHFNSYVINASMMWCNIVIFSVHFHHASTKSKILMGWWHMTLFFIHIKHLSTKYKGGDTLFGFQMHVHKSTKLWYGGIMWHFLIHIHLISTKF